MPADLRLISAADLTVDESALTGESLPVRKAAGILEPQCLVADRSNMLHAATVVLTGRAKAVVAHTGSGTEIGRIAGLLGEAGALLPLIVKLNRLGHTIAVVMFCCR